MVRAVNSFALFCDEEAEDASVLIAKMEKKLAEEAERKAIEEEVEAAWAEAILEDAWRTRRRMAQLKRAELKRLALLKKNGEEKADAQGMSNGNGGSSNRGQDGRSSKGNGQGQSRSSSGGGRNNQGGQSRPVSGSDNGNAVERMEPSKDAADGDSGEKGEVVAESEEQRKAREEWEIRKARREARQKAEEEEWAIDATLMTLKKYEEKVLSEKRKALEDKAKKVEERKVTLDQELQTMRLIERKEEDDLSIKLDPKTEKSSKLKKKSDKIQKISIFEFQKHQEDKNSQGEANTGCGSIGCSQGRGAVANFRNGENIRRNGANFRNGENSRRDGPGQGHDAAANFRNGENPHRDGANFRTGENSRKYDSYRKPTDNGIRNGRGGYQREISYEPGAMLGDQTSSKTLVLGSLPAGNARRDGSYKKTTYSGNNGGNHNKGGGYQKETSYAPAARSNKLSAQIPPPVEDTEIFPDLSKAAVKA